MMQQTRFARVLLPLTFAALLAACGGNKEETPQPGVGQNPDGSTPLPPLPTPAPNPAPMASPAPSPSPGTTSSPAPTAAPSPSPSPPADVAMGVPEARRILKQATFGPSESLVTRTASQSVRGFLQEQFSLAPATYVRGGTDAVHKWTNKDSEYCDQFADGTPEAGRCWGWNYSSQPVTGDFFSHAVSSGDQLRQRMAFALSQILVVSDWQVEGTYGMREYQQMLRNSAFGNYRDLLKEVTLSPVMGWYLSNVDNDKTAPNENYARELLQLFSIGVCALNIDGTLKGGKCEATYGNNEVREYAFALTGWVYPKGGANPWCNKNGAPGTLCWDDTNPRYLKGKMASMTSRHDATARTLLSGATLAASRTPEQALEVVLDSLMAHPNTAPFISKQLIQFLVTSNPSPAYVARVAAAFNAGSSNGFGSGRKGDLQATVAAILMDVEARDAAVASQPSFGKLREPTLYMISALRALNGTTDGYAFSADWMFGGSMGQTPFQAPSVFNFYPPDYPLPGKADLVGPQFGIESVRATFERINFANTIVMFPEWADWILKPRDAAEWPNPRGTSVNMSAFEADAATPALLVNRLADLLTEGRMPQSDRDQIITAMNAWQPADDAWLAKQTPATNHKQKRAKTAAYLMLSSQYSMVQR
jgi:Protein of unknown function (DUF1800)